jgi:putative oxygen-independent coproporphyrinogen III oxidase
VSASLPLSLYIHIPWCVRKCPYCDFNSHPQKGPLPEDRYVDRLLQDFEADLALVAARPIDTVFFGGGTPSLFSGPAIARLLDGLRARAAFAPDVEITLEANPGTVDAGNFAGYLAAGVKRLSIGAQSFDPRALARLGRIHAPDDIGHAVTTARRLGFERLNLDLMHGLPEQTVTAALVDLDRALGLGVDHLSWYQLTLEPRTPFAARPPKLPAEHTLAEIEARGFERLEHNGLRRYEISAFARANEAARHNVNYWTFGDYLGIGAGAHGKITGPAAIVRTEKPKAPERYLAAPLEGLRRETRLSRDVLPGEFMLNALRLIDGVDAELFEARTGLPLATIASVWQAQVERGLMRRERLAVTDFGRRHLDSVVAAFF